MTARRPPPSVGVSAAVLATAAVVAVGGLLWRPGHDQDLFATGVPPSTAHWLGTDHLGRDVLGRLVSGAGATLLGPVVVSTVAMVLAVTVGVLSGYRGGLFDAVVARVVDVLFALPGLLVVLVVAAVVGGGPWVSVVMLSVLICPGDIRVLRGATLAQRNLPYVEAVRTMGVRPVRIMFGQILPNIAPLVLASVAVNFGVALLGLSGLAFLGVGTQVGSPEWGRILAEGQQVVSTNPAAVLAPSVLIVAITAAVSLVADWEYDRQTGPTRRLRNVMR